MSMAASGFGRTDAAEKVATLLINIAREHVK